MSGFRLFVRIVELFTAACLLLAIVLLAYKPKIHVASTSVSTGVVQPVDGAKVFSQHCSGCHGSDGGGGSGPKLTGAVVTKYPNAADERAVVVNGRGGMPAWDRFLTPAEIDAVVAYTRR